MNDTRTTETHTPGTLTVGDYGSEFGSYASITKRKGGKARSFIGYGAGTLSRSDAERIAACWNAFIGVPTDQIARATGGAA